MAPVRRRRRLALSTPTCGIDPFSDAATDAVPALRAAARAAARRARRSWSAARSPRPTTRSRRWPATRG